MKRNVILIPVSLIVIAGLTACTPSSNSGPTPEDIHSTFILVEPDPEKPVPTYNLTAIVEPRGAGNITPGKGLFYPGEELTLNATASKGFMFSSWSGNISGNEPQKTIIMDSDKTVIARFTDISFPLVTDIAVSSVTDTTVNITWSTSEEAVSQVKYGVSKLDYKDTLPQAPAYGTSHTVLLSQLTPGTTYHFRITATDRAGNRYVSRDIAVVTRTTRECISTTFRATVFTPSLHKLDYGITNNSSRVMTVNSITLYDEQGRPVYTVPESTINETAPAGILTPGIAYYWIEQMNPPLLVSDIGKWEIRWDLTDAWGIKIIITDRYSPPF